MLRVYWIRDTTFWMYPSTENDEATPTLPDPLLFPDARRQGEMVTIAAVGDVILHPPLQLQAYASEVGYWSLWKDIAPLIHRADIAYANQEGPSAAGVTEHGEVVADPGAVVDGQVYSGYPRFNYHPSLAGGLKDLGIDVVSLANNHSLDRRSIGVDKTIEAVRAAGLAFTGVVPSDGRDRKWHTISEACGFRIGWIGCTYGTNEVPDPRRQVLRCYEDTEVVEATIRALLDSGVDAVVVTPHWGKEYTREPDQLQRRLAKRLLDAGALAIIGTHPHVVQPWEKVTAADGRETLVVYSLGNFVSRQIELARRSSILLYVGLTRGRDGTTTINGVRYVALTMHSGDSWAVHPSDRGQDEASHRHVRSVFGSYNELASDAPLFTALE